MSTPPTPPVPPIPHSADLAAAYQATYDALGAAYWAAPDLATKDLLHQTQNAIGVIITQLDQEDIANNTAAFVALTPQLKAINDQLKKIEASVNQITQNIDTVSSVLAAANKVLSLLPL